LKIGSHLAKSGAKTERDLFPDTVYIELEMRANAQRDGHPAEHRWRPLFNAVKFG